MAYRTEKMVKIVNFEKGVEVGSNNYFNARSNDSINFLRVGDLASLGNTYILKYIAKNLAKETDILLALDGAPGRNAIGIKGAFSSSLYRLNCSNEFKGLVYFSLNSNLNKQIISNYSHGTTIVHASKCINFLEIPICSADEINILNTLFKLIILTKKKMTIFKKTKNILLNKYFISQ